MPSNTPGRRPAAALFFALFMTLVLSPVNVSGCPLGPRETRLEISRVMRNFGRFLLKADQLSREGTKHPQDVTDQQIAAAIDGIRLAHSCARAVLDAKNDELAPAKAGQMQGEERERYLQKYRSQMQDFATALDEFKSLFEGLLKTEKDRRDFSPLDMKREEVRERANKAHAEL